MQLIELQSELESQITKAINKQLHEGGFFESKLWEDANALIGDDTLALAAKAAACVILGAVESQEYAQAQGYLVEKK